jgi:protein-tyrosine phosphatase
MITTSVVRIFETADYDAEVQRAADMLRGGGLVVLPTETVYGIAGMLTQPAARQRLRALRGGGDGKPLTIHLARRADAARFLGPVSEFGQRLMNKVWPGPVGLTFDVPAERRAQVARELELLESEIYDADGTITLRCPDHFVSSEVLARAGGPVVLINAATGGGSAQDVAQFAADLEGKVDLIVDAGPTRFNKVSTLLRVRKDRYEIVRAGIYDERIIERLLRTTLLFVCSGNTCRSPMAEAIARKVLSDKLNVPQDDLEKKGISVISAGSFAMPGARATPQAVDVIHELGGDLSKHRSRPLSVELIHQADVIFTMSRGHAGAVTALVPSAAEKTVTLDPDKDIDDPIGGDVQLYRDVAGQIKELIERRLDEKVLSHAGVGVDNTNHPQQGAATTSGAAAGAEEKA